MKNTQTESNGGGSESLKQQSQKKTANVIGNAHEQDGSGDTVMAQVPSYNFEQRKQLCVDEFKKLCGDKSALY